MTQDSSSDSLFSSQTIVPGKFATAMDGIPQSLARAETEAVLGSFTEVSTTSVGMGGIIMSGFEGGEGDGAGKTSTPGTDVEGTTFTGNAARGMITESAWMFAIVVGIGFKLYQA